MSIVYSNSESFKKDIEKGTVLVDFYADWCGPCKMLEPILQEIDGSSNLSIVKVDVDKYQDIASDYGVMSMPTMILFKDGEQKAQKIGLTSKEDLEAWIESV